MGMGSKGLRGGFEFDSEEAQRDLCEDLQRMELEEEVILRA